MRRFITIFMGLILAAPAFAANHFVRARAEGIASGDDWANAYTRLPDSLTRGDTYYVADGAYGSHVFDDAASGTTLITIKKATIADHGTAAGWNDAYGTGTADFRASDSTGVLKFQANYYVLDGNTPVGTYGITVSGAPWLPGGFSRNVELFGTSHITIKSLYIDNNSQSWVNGIDGNGNDSMLFSNIKVSNTNLDAFQFAELTNTTFEYIWVDKRVFDVYLAGGEAIAIFGGSDNVIRYSKFDWQGEQIALEGPGRSFGRHDIYGNIFFGGDVAGQGVVSAQHDFGPGPVYVYNNTFANVNIGVYLYENMLTGAFKNNIFFSVSEFHWQPGVVHDYNWYYNTPSQTETHLQNGIGDPFVNSGGGDYQLAAATNAGDTTIGSTYDTDRDGVVRGADGVWDRGAYEYNVTPTVFDGGTVNAASYALQQIGVAPGSILTIFGSNLSDGSQNPNPQVVNGQLQTTLGGSSVTIDGIPAPIFYSFPDQVAVQLPYELSGHVSADVVVTTAQGESMPRTILLDAAAPGIFTVNQAGSGQGAILLANSAVLAAPVGSVPGIASQPVQRGGVITIFCTGLGVVSPAMTTGELAPLTPDPTPTQATVTIDGLAATVFYSGTAPGFVGLDQVNVQVPQGASLGDNVPVVISLDGRQSNTATIAVGP